MEIIRFINHRCQKLLDEMPQRDKSPIKLITWGYANCIVDQKKIKELFTQKRR